MADVMSRLLSRFPALGALRPTRANRLPVVQQHTTADCGAACLTMVLALHGRQVPLDEVRQVASGGSGTSAHALLEAGRWFGLIGRGVKVDQIKDLSLLPKGTILHWQFHHFVVFDEVVGESVALNDPAVGRRVVEPAEVARSFTGIALVFEPGRQFQTARRPKRGIARYVDQILAQRESVTRVLVVSLVFQLLALALPVLTGVVVDRVVPRGDHGFMPILAIGLAMVVAFRYVVTALRAHLLLHIRTRLDAKLTLEFFEHLLDLPLPFFKQRTTGDLMLRIESNTSIRDLLTSSTLSIFLDGGMVLLYLGVLFIGHWQMGLLVLVLALARLLLFARYRKRHRELMSELLQTRAATRGDQIQMLAGIETLKAAGAEPVSLERWSHKFVGELNVGLLQGRIDARIQAALDALSVASPLVILLVGADLVLNGELTLGAMLALSALAAGVLQPLSTLVTTAFDLERVGSYMERINDVMDTAPEQDRSAIEPAPEITGQVSLEKVSFRYGPLLPLVVRDVSLDIQPGSLVALVGRSGSGKSTLASLIVGLVQPSAGHIFFDGHDLAGIDMRGLRRQIGSVTQAPYLFGTSVRENISFGHDDASLARIMEAARLAEIHDDIMALPMGYNSQLADGGASLSGGQRQRIALARALFHRPRLLLLDEATSALDNITERRIHERLARLRTTRIVIAHRLSTIRDADRIFVIEEGRVVEHGNHEELLARGGAYAALVGSKPEPTSPR